MDEVFQPSDLKRRSSILKPPEKRNRDSRTVSFSEKYLYKELHQDGTSEITNLFMGQDMDISEMAVIEPELGPHDRTIEASIDMSLDQMITPKKCSVDETYTADMSLGRTTIFKKSYIESQHNTVDMSLDRTTMPKYDTPKEESFTVDMSMDRTTMPTNGAPREGTFTVDMSLDRTNDMDSTLKEETITANMSSDGAATQRNITPEKENIVEDLPAHRRSLPKNISLEDASITEDMPSHRASIANNNSTLDDQNCTLTGDGMTNDISVPHYRESLDETFFGAFHDSNDLTRTSEPDSLIHNIEALDACIQQIESNQRELDDEIEDLLKFYRHIVNKDNKYEFAIKIFGLRYGLWLIIKINPEMYPNEKLTLKFAVNKKDRHLYPFPEFARAVKQFTHEGRKGYLTRFVINAQKFRRFLRANNDRKQIK